MCRILSLYWLQRWKGSISGVAQDFKHIEMRGIIKFFLQGKAPKEIHTILTEKLGEHAPCTVENCVAHFKRGDFPLVMLLILDETKQWPLRRLLIKFTT